jgi:sugar O-acyltransferase (sialic acid O-acetyltransferase NeuD family)
MDHRIVILGSGSHAKHVFSIYSALGKKRLLTIEDNPNEQVHQTAERISWRIATGKDASQTHGNLAVADNARRRALSEGLRMMGQWPLAVHPSAIVDTMCLIREGTVIGAKAALGPGVVIGVHAIIDAGAVVGCNTRVGNFVHIGSGTILGEEVEIQEGACLGIGCRVLPGIKIGAWAKVPMGAFVTKDISSENPPTEVVPGVVARCAG